MNKPGKRKPSGLSRREDAKAMRLPNCPETDNSITKFYRAGYSIM